MIVLLSATVFFLSGVIMFALGQWSGQEKEKSKPKPPQPKWGRDDENNSK